MKKFLPPLLFTALVALSFVVQPLHVRSAQSGVTPTTAQSKPTAQDSAAALQKLAADLAKLIDLKDELKTGKVGVVVRSMVKNQDLFTISADKPLTPASTTKVVTTFTALSELGPDYLIKTVIGMANRPTAEGALVGDLYVKGFGDPFLTSTDIDALVDGALNSGLKSIQGNIVGDNSFFDDKVNRMDYSGDGEVVEPVPPIAALSIDKSIFTLVVSAGRIGDEPLNVQTIPRSAAFEIVNEAVSVAPRAATRGKRRGRAELAPIDSDSLPRYGDEPTQVLASKGRRVAKYSDAPANSRTSAASALRKSSGGKEPLEESGVGTKTRNAAPAKSTGPLKVSMTAAADGHQIITVTGSMPTNRTVSYRYMMKNPALVVAGMVFDRLQSHGVTITGKPVVGVSAPKIKMISQIQRPLLEVLTSLMKHSDNFLAEYVFKMIGANAGGRTETAKHSIIKISQRMSLSGVQFDKCVINDGSGLSRNNCLSADALASILSAAHRDKKLFTALYSCMSIAGVDGTLRKRMKGTLAENNVHGKTGTLRNVSALTGYVTTRDGELMTFAMLMNGGNHGAYRSVQDKVAERLAAFSYRAAQ